MDVQLIQKEILNQLTLGQWELAKSLILVYWKHSPDEDDSQVWITRVLLNVCAKPDKYCVGSLSLPSKYHLSWLALQLIEELKIETSEVAYLRKASEFKFYIYKSSKICNEIPYEELAAVFEAQHLISNESKHCENVLLSTNIENFLYDLKNKDPFLAFYIVKSLLDENNFHTFGENLTFNWIRNKSQLIKTFVSKDGVDKHSVALGEQILAELRNNLLILVKSNKYADVHSYLNHRLTTCLRPLLVLLSWDVIQTNDDAKKVLDCLWPDSLDKKNFEPTYVQACDRLVRNVNFAHWCLEQREKNSEVATSEETTFSHLCLSLKSHSVVYVLKQYLQLSKLNINAVEDILLTFMSPKSATKEKSVRFDSETVNDDWEDKVQKSVDCKILQSYCIMSAAMEAVQFSAEFEGWCRNKKVRKNRLTESVTPDDEKWTLMYREKVINNLDEVEQLLPSLYPLVHRLEILENLFALIFATHEDMRADINTDSGQSSEYEDDNRDVAHSEDDGDARIKDASDDDAKAKKTGQCLSDGMSVLSNCSGNSSTNYNYKRQGFLCNDTVIRSLLLCIKDNLLDICLKFEKRNAVTNLVFWNDDGKHTEIREKKFLQRIAELKKYVSEAIWRFEIISANESDKRNSVRITPCLVYLKIEEGKLSQTTDNGRGSSSPKTTDSYSSSMFSTLSKARKRSRAHLNSAQFHGCSNTHCCHETVNKMLSSKESLLNMCLQQMDSIKAQQVIKVFAMEETDSAAEIIFSQRYVQLLKQYEATKIRAAPLIPATPSVPSSLSESLCHIASTAAAGMTATTDITTVDGFLSCCEMPSTLKIEECMKIAFNPFCQELAECRDLKALVLCDLAFTSGQSMDSSASLLHAAIKRLNSIDEHGQFQSRVAGLYNFASRMISLISEVSSKQNSHNLFTQDVFPKQTNLCSLLAQGSISLKAENYSHETDNMNSLLENLTLYYDLKAKYANQDLDTKKFDIQMITDLHNAFSKLVRDGSIQLKQKLSYDNTSMECQYPNYLKTVYVYMRQLATLKAHQNPEQKDMTSHCDFLTVLDQGLTSTLIDMVKEKDANIEWIEKFTVQFGLDFKHLITQACVGTISAIGYKPTEYGKAVINKYGQIILNQELHEKSQQNPNSVVNDLLVNIIYFIKGNCEIFDGIVTFNQLQQHEEQIQALLHDTNKLSSVDLGLLKTHDECCAFLINVSNLLSFHATMFRTCNEKSVRFGRGRLLNESCQVAYYVGQFGVISLFELHCLLGYTADLKIPESILELRKSGIMDSFCFPHPKVSFLINRFFMTSPKIMIISADNLNNDLSCATAEYLKAHVVLKIAEKEIFVPEYLTTFLMACSDNQSLLALIKTHCGLEQSRNSEFKLVTKPSNYLPAVVLSYPQKGFEFYAIEPLQGKIAIDVNEIPKHIRDYLRDKCWLVDYLIDILGGQMNSDERMIYLNRLLDESNSISPTEILVPAVHQINFWIDLENKLMLNNDLENLLNFIDVSSAMRLEMKKCITPLRDFILCYLLNENIASNLPQNIKNCYLQGYIVLAMYRNWDYNYCMNCILHVATDRDIKGELRKKLIILYERMSIYSQIIKVLSVDFCWQDIEDKSLNNPDEVLSLLTDDRHYSLAIEWARLHSLSEELRKRVQHVNLILHLDKEEPDLVQAIIILENMTDRSSAVDMCDEALNLLDNLKSQVFIIEYLVNDLAAYLTDTKKEELHLRHMGIKIMYCLPQTDSKYFAEILSRPALVVEQLIMNTKIELLGKSLEVIKTDILALNPHLPASAESMKSLLKTYARKSLEVQIIQPKLSPASTYEKLTKSRGRNSESFNIPIHPPKKEDWIPDDQHTHCQVCREEAFNMFNRRHHCRRCGRVVCANCSRHRMNVEGYEDVKVRVCDMCKDVVDIGLSHSPSSVFGMSIDKKIRHSNSIRDRNGSSASLESFRLDESYQWLLKLHEEHNATVRDEFYFEQTPNVSLCISLLDCFLREKEAATFVLELCEILFVVLQPNKDFGLPNPEVNHNVIVSVIESLLMSAKVKFANLSNHDGMGKCDLFLHNLNLVKLLITSNCYHLVPRGINSHEDIRQLINQLVIEERWSLALEVTTKNRLDDFQVWTRWGLALLEACDFTNAREKFAQSLGKKVDKRNFSIVTDIIKQLELNLYKKDDEMITIKNCLTSLKAIRKQGGQALLPKRIGVHINEFILNECLFYLQAYGQNASLISFLIRHQKVDMALKIIKEKDSELFINSVFMPCVHLKLLSQLEKELFKIDSTLSCWSYCLEAVYKHLERLKYYNTLHQLQTFCKDYIRSASTCVKLFSSNAGNYDILFDRLSILETACSHLQTALQEKQNKPRAVPHQPKWKGYHPNSQLNTGLSIQQDLPIEKIQMRFDTIQYQMEITKFFKEKRVDTLKLIKEIRENPSDKENAVPVVFGNTTSKTELSAMLFLANDKIENGFEMSSKCIEKCHLENSLAFRMIGRVLVQKHRYEDARQLITFMGNKNITTEKIDEMIWSCLTILVLDSYEHSEADKFILRLTSGQHKVCIVYSVGIGSAAKVAEKAESSDSNISLLSSGSNCRYKNLYRYSSASIFSLALIQINAYKLCGRLRHGYIEAIKTSDAKAVNEIAKAAEKSGNKQVLSLCTKWLEQNKN
uniref:FYVE-type domain-containing protein n=1 Tax=Strigamia maritima TaxID=126957 RepID=T1J980_STRMM